MPSFYVMEVMRAAAALESEGRSVLHLEVGQPSTGAPAGALAAASAALARSAAGADALGYTSEAGVPPLRAAVAAMYARRHALAVPPERCAPAAAAALGTQLLTRQAVQVLHHHGEQRWLRARVPGSV